MLLAAPELAAESLGMEVDERLENLALIYLLLCPEPALEQFCCHINRQNFIGDFIEIQNGIIEWFLKFGAFSPLLLLDDWRLSIVRDYYSQNYFR